MRLSSVQRACGDRVDVHWRAFPLVPDHRPGRVSTSATCESRRRAAAEEPRAIFEPPEPGTPLPVSSIPAMMAAKAAEHQGTERFDAFHRALFRAHFGANLDIGRADVLRAVAETSGLDVARFERDAGSDAAYRAVLDDYAEAVAWFGVSAVPTVIFNDKVALVGAVPAERYRLLVDWITAGEPGGLIPLDFADGDTAAGQSTAAQHDRG